MTTYDRAKAVHAIIDAIEALERLPSTPISLARELHPDERAILTARNMIPQLKGLANALDPSPMNEEG